MSGTMHPERDRAFAAWRAADPAHAAAFDAAAAARMRAAALADAPAMLALRHEAVARAALGRRAGRTRRLGIAAGAALLVGAPLAAWAVERWAPAPAAPVFARALHTGIGERATLMLPDGSRVTLDTDSRVAVRFDGDRRVVRLDGQAWFDLVAGTDPIDIRAGGRAMTIGVGAFDVRSDRGTLSVYARSGRIALDGIALAPGQAVTIRDDAATITRPRDAEAIGAWRDGLVQFRDVPLGVAAAELNRYRRRPIRVADARTAALAVSGSFRTSESSVFVEAVTTGLPVRVVRDDRDGVVIAAR